MLQTGSEHDGEQFPCRPENVDIRPSVSCFMLFAYISWRSSRNSARALAISERQEKRREPQIGIYLANGYRRRTLKQQLFGFLVSISNPTDINNSVARAELQLTCVLKNDAKTIYRLQHNPGVGKETMQTASAATVFTLPQRVDAHQTVSGWLLFALDNDLLRNMTVDSHSLILEDTHGVSANTDPITVTEWHDERQEG